MSKIKNENYVTIQGWMINELGLKGNELMCYAIIYGFSQTTGQDFTGSYQYLADWCNIDRRSVIRVINNLLSKGLIVKVIETNKKGEQKIVLTVPEVVTNCHWGSDKMSPEGSDKMSPNNIDKKYNNRLIDNNNNNKELEKIFENKNIFISAEMKKIIPEDRQEYFYKLQDVVTEIYKSPVYRKYISSITYDDLANSYERCCNAKNVKNDIAYMKRILLEQKRKQVTA